MRAVMVYWLVTTQHLVGGLWFQDREDYVVGMNLVPVAAGKTSVSILGFVLMSNHVHFVLKGEEVPVRAFINLYKNLYSRYYGRKYDRREYLRNVQAQVQPLAPGDESIERSLAYVMMNPVAAGICLYPTQYPWGSGTTLFSERPHTGVRPLGELSQEAQRKILHSREALPGHYLLTDEGYIHPSSYVEGAEVFFRTPKRLHYFLMSSSKARSRSAQAGLPGFRDQTLNASIQDLCRSLFQKETVEELSLDECTELLRQLKRRFGADTAQLSRVSGISPAEVETLLDRP